MLPRLEPKAVVVLDYASYHSRRLEKTPVSRWRIQDIQEWLTSIQISFEPYETKVVFSDKVKAVKHQYQLHVIDEMAKEVGVEVLR